MRWKIASGEITNTPMIEKMIETRKPLLISTGLANFAIIKNLIKKIKTQKFLYYAMHLFLSSGIK